VALLCCAARRVLQPGGVFLLVTLGDPSKRLHLLCKPEYKWQVSLLLLPKITPDNQAMEGGRWVPPRLPATTGKHLHQLHSGPAAVGLEDCCSAFVSTVLGYGPSPLTHTRPATRI
jgi:hypothetical protein